MRCLARKVRSLPAEKLAHGTDSAVPSKVEELRFENYRFENWNRLRAPG